uniref:Uncharacterized protein n=1 Tax=Utricularia reniformis TaxID=192314 RepID=A0A1Y0B029_9LAMI|nr:hypothetical protein AEK19_MT0536 [Utricularia reniformis]ART30792.1 hypothetical protein AEK19_MT0536 [Utricularia reniformis]
MFGSILECVDRLFSCFLKSPSAAGSNSVIKSCTSQLRRYSKNLFILNNSLFHES